MPTTGSFTVRTGAFGALWLVVALAACSGGGGGPAGGGGEVTPPVTGPPPAPPQESDPISSADRASFETPEYFNNANEVVDAAAAYARGATGAGITVGVIDGQVVPSHYDLDQQIVEIQTFGDGPFERDHAMGVTGLIAAERNGIGMHGVAFDSRIVNYAIVEQDGTIPVASMQAALNAAATGPAAVVNNSYGSSGGGLSLDTLRAMRALAAGNKIAVWAAGNDSTGGERAAPTPQAAAPSADATLEPSWLAAVSYNPATGTLSDFSAGCGIAADWCLAAPGHRVLSLVSDPNLLARWSGTSFAAAVASGAMALLLDRFPSLTPQQARSILLETATDLGEPGVDALFGHGLIHLERATRPIGTLSVPTGQSVDDGGMALEDSTLTAGAALGDGLSRAIAGLEVAVLDAYQRAYRVALPGEMAARGRRLDGVSLLRGFGGGAPVRRTPLGAAGSAAFVEDPYRDEVPSHGALSFRVGPLVASAERGPLAAPPVAALAALSPRPLRALPQDAGNPFLGLVAEGVRLGLGRGSLGLTAATDEERGTRALALERAFNADGTPIRLALGMLLEDGAALGTTGTGAFSLDGASTETTFASAGTRLALGGPFSLTLAAHAGFSRLSGTAAGLIRDFSGLSTAAGAELAWREPAGRGTLLTFAVSQPLRLENGGFRLDVPVARDAAGSLRREDRRLSAEPSGREIDLELGWSMPLLDSRARLNASLLHRLAANHQAGASETMILMRVRAGL